MKTALKSKTQVVLTDVEPLEMKPDEIRIKVKACGICGTDLHADNEDLQPFGHEMVGEIIELGEHVANFEIGQQVMIESSTACGRCDNCRDTRQELCTNIQSVFFKGNFGMAETCVGPAACAIPCEDLPADVATLSEPLGVAIDMFRLAEINTRSNVLVMGAGPIGLMAATLAKRAGARRVFINDFKSRTARFDAAEKIGVNGFIDAGEVAVKDYDFGCKIDRIMVTSPPPTLNSAFELAATGAIISFIGIGHGDAAFCNFDVNAFHFKKLQLRASFASPALFGAMALDYLREGVIDGEALISHRFSLDQIVEAMEIANDPTAIKVIIQP